MEVSDDIRAAKITASIRPRSPEKRKKKWLWRKYQDKLLSLYETIQGSIHDRISQSNEIIEIKTSSQE